MHVLAMVIMRIVLVSLVAALFALAPAALGKDDTTVLRICGSSGCKVVKHQVDSAALFGTAERLGVRAPKRPSGPYYTVRLVDREGAMPVVEYRVSVSSIEELVATSDPEAAKIPLGRATSGVRPYDVSSGGRAAWGMGIAAAVLVATAATVFVARRRVAR